MEEISSIMADTDDIRGWTEAETIFVDHSGSLRISDQFVKK